VYKDMMKNTTGDYTDPLIIIKSASGSSQVNFGISDVENGEIFRWVGNMYKEPLMLEKYEALQELYLKDPLRPLQVTLVARRREDVGWFLIQYRVKTSCHV
jgi:hypothetical protein